VKICFAHAADGGVAVEVTDDGCGSDSEVGTAGTRLGLVSMRERTQRWGGRLEVGPHPSGGWTVRVTLPGPALTGGPRTDGTDAG
jgi:signal transduction histidine kinase